ncbi:hypothetical protein Pla52o_46820 [Novipirellula galeiformis]|uniref:Uncharacterized protein n=2 Tax=Novipirellula galeiformis TaxID=2528004 RepID=A0A5C6C819_9BACT|nr:hypothetical protein Pla52o_46820 [Novipirellula galeiformis]
MLQRFVLIAFLAVGGSRTFAQDEFQTVDSPFAQEGPKAVYINDQGSYFLGNRKGAAIYSYANKTYWSELKFVRSAGLRATDNSGFTEQGFIYKDKEDPTSFFFGASSFNTVDGRTRWRLYISGDGQTFTGVKTYSGTVRSEPTQESVTDFLASLQGASDRDSSSGARFPLTTDTVTDHDGQTTAYVHAKASRRSQDGLVELFVRVKKAGLNGSGYAYGQVVLLDDTQNTLFKSDILNVHRGANADPLNNPGVARGKTDGSFTVPLDVINRTRHLAIVAKASNNSGLPRDIDEFTASLNKIRDALEAGRGVAEEAIKIYLIASGG